MSMNVFTNIYIGQEIIEYSSQPFSVPSWQVCTRYLYLQESPLSCSSCPSLPWPGPEAGCGGTAWLCKSVMVCNGGDGPAEGHKIYSIVSKKRGGYREP